MSTSVVPPPHGHAVLALDSVELELLEAVLRAPPIPPLTRWNTDLAEAVARSGPQLHEWSFEDLDRMEEALATHDALATLSGPIEALLKKLQEAGDRPVPDLGRSLSTVIRQIRSSDFQNILKTIPVDLWPRCAWSLSMVWEPLMDSLSASKPSEASEALWQTLTDLGLIQRVFGRRDRQSHIQSFIHTLANTGPFDLDKGLDVWKAQMRQALTFTSPDMTTEGEAVRMLSKLLRAGAHDVADLMLAQGLLDPHSISLGFAHRAAHNDVSDAENWAWFQRHVDPMAPDTHTGEAIWRVLAKHWEDQPGSPSAREWGRRNDPQGLAEIENEEYFLALSKAETLTQLRTVLFSRTDWASVISLSGEPATWTAVHNNTEILAHLPSDQVDWHVRNSQGQDLWFAFVSSQSPKDEMISYLANHVQPKLTPEGNGWLCDCPDLLLTIDQVPHSVLHSNAYVCWAGTQEKQDQLADRFFHIPWKVDGNQAPPTRLMLETQGGLAAHTFASMSPRLKAWWAIWSQGFKQPDEESRPLDLNLLFPEGPHGLHLPPIRPAQDRASPACLWQEGHDEWNERARVRLREWKASAPAAEPSSPSARRPRVRP